MTVEIFVLSLNHRVTPLDVREAVVFGDDDGRRFLQEVKERGQIEEAMLV